MHPKRVRGTGRARTVRRTIARGGAGVAEPLNDAVGGWPGVRITPMFGRWGYFVGNRLFACFPLRPKEHDLWILLTLEDQARALKTPGITPHRRFARRGWVECQVDSREALPRALAWLRRSYEFIRTQPERD
ncbi:MAG: MmcQ/YjbR family DNA-binding protein [Candidatus Rokubacteria bacterium]|nr:MmcQ/YjbR family DNA-binding protein [Candidatus Rokubacteria bacterium]